MSEELRMSKYARKRAARMKAEAAASRTFAAIDLAVRITEGTAKPPSTPPHPKPKQTAPPPRSQINDLGDRPRRLADTLAEVVMKLREAEGIVNEIQALANTGRQSAEPLALAQFIVAVRPRFIGMVDRAERIPNKPQRNGGAK